MPMEEGRRDSDALGMWIFLATEVMFFGAAFLAYFHIRIHDPRGFAAASRHTHEWLGTINTAILLTSSLAMALAVRSAQLGARRLLSRSLWLTAALGVAFIAVKAYEYGLEWRDGLVPRLHFTYRGAQAGAVETFFYLYFVLTGVHALHLAVGVACVTWVAARVDGEVAQRPRPEGIEVLGLYWHFVDAIWVFLYPLIYLVALWR